MNNSFLYSHNLCQIGSGMAWKYGVKSEVGSGLAWKSGVKSLGNRKIKK